MKNKNDWITQGTNISCKHRISLYAFTNNCNYPNAKADYIQYFKILRKVIQDAKKWHYSRLIAESNNKIKTWKIIKKETGKIHSVQQVPSLLVKVGKLKDPTNVPKASNNFFITITEKWNIQQIEKGDDPILKDSFPGNFSSIKIIAIIVAGIKSIIHSPKPKKHHQVKME